MKDFDFAVLVHNKDGNAFDSETVEKCVINAVSKGEIDRLRVMPADGDDLRIEVTGKAVDIPDFKVAINQEIKIVYPTAKLEYI